MSDRPTPPPSDADPGRPDPGTPPPADDTAVLPQGATEAQAHPQPSVASADAAAAAPPPGGPAPYGPPGAQGGYNPYARVSGAPGTPGGPGGPRRWWGEATSTGGGRAALAVAGVLGVLVLLAGVVLAGGILGRVVGDRHHDRMGFADQRFSDGPGRSEDAPGRQKDKQGGPGNGNGNGNGRGQGQAPGPGNGDGQGNRNGQGMGQGMGRGMGQGLGGLGAGVLHGEFTTNVTGTPTVMVVQTGEVTTYTSGRSLTVKSSDGFSASYALDGSNANLSETDDLATGSQVRVVAAKEGMKVTRLVVIG